MNKWLIFRNIIIIGIISTMLLETSLRLSDPLTVLHFNDWNHALIPWMRSHPTGYRLPEGIYKIRGHTITILEDGTRLTPEFSDSGCTIAFVGDSFTFGWGVSDNQTFAYLIDKMLPYADFVNVARTGYDGTNLSRLADYYQADGYIYLAVSNDAYPAITPIETPPLNWLAVEDYYDFLTRRDLTDIADYQVYHGVLQSLNAHDTIAFSFEGNHLNPIIDDYLPLVELDNVPRFGAGDLHPTVAGHRRISEQMLPIIEAYVTERCKITD